MSAQRLSDRKTRQIAATTGLDIIRAWTFGDPDTLYFVTRNHQHGTFSKKNGTWAIEHKPTHFSTCNLIDPSTRSGYRGEVNA